MAAALLPTINAASQDAVFSTETRVVEVTLIATDRNQPVSDLSVNEIELFDNRREQRIQSFQLIGSSDRSDTKAAPRHTVVLLDGLNTDFSDQARVRSALSNVFRDFENAGDRIAVFVLSRELHKVSDFTNNVAPLEEIVAELALSPPPLDVQSLAGGSGMGGMMPDPTRPQQDAGNRVNPGNRGTGELVQMVRNRVTKTLDALTSIARATAHIPGQKNLIWLSSTFPMQVNPPNGTPVSFFNDVERMTNELNAANINLYPVDPRGVTGNRNAQVAVQTMKLVAQQTGGLAYTNTNDLAGAIETAISDTRVGYVLTYSPDNYGEDGDAHDIRIKTSRKRVKLRYRPGYVARSQIRP